MTQNGFRWITVDFHECTVVMNSEFQYPNIGERTVLKHYQKETDLIGNVKGQ